jgi:hypothetical protein
MPQCFDLRKSAVELVIKKMSSGRLPGRTGAHS